MRIVSFGYDLLVLLLSPIAAIVFLFYPRGRVRLGERFGLRSIAKGTYDKWWHASSVGELSGILPLLNKTTLPQILTISSPSALSITLPVNVSVRLAPFDCSVWYHLLFRHAQIGTLVVTETELWPGILQFAKRRGLRICWINMRIRERSVQWYRLLRTLYASAIEGATICASSPQDATRWSGVFSNRPAPRVLGNSKFDRLPSIGSIEQATAIYAALFKTPSQLLVLGSIHPIEMRILQHGLAKLIQSNPTLQVIVAPRHRERDGDIAKILSAHGIKFERKSQMQTPTSERVILLDTFGELEGVYSIADVAFVGGSLVDVGGHNPLEASQYGCPVIMGPHTEVVESVCEELQLNDALFRIKNSDDFVRIADRLLRDADWCKRIAVNAKKVAHGHTGASARIWAALQEGQVAHV